VCPDIVLHHSDEYIAGLINKLSFEHQNIFVVCGYGQSRTIPYHLYYNPRVFLHDGLKRIVSQLPTYETLLRKDTPEISVDKMALIDLIFNDKTL
jgi:hypothetical protein